jgi:alpha-glucoside transport system substrate-binding protein
MDTKQTFKPSGKPCPWCGENNLANAQYCAACSGSLARVETRYIQELGTAWEVVQLRQGLRGSGGWSIFWGIVAVFVGFSSLQESELNFLLVLIGLFLIGTGIATRRSPGPGTLQADAFAMLLVGGWNIIILLTGTYFGVIGIFQIIGAIQRFAQQSKFNQMHYVSESRIIQAETLVARARQANSTADNLIQFRAKGKNWKARLAPEVVTLVAGNAQQVRFVSDSQFTLTTETEPTSGKQVKVSIQVGLDTWRGEMSLESLERYEVWQTEPKARLPEASHKHPAPSLLEPFIAAQEREPATEIPQPIPESKSLQEANTLSPAPETPTSSPETEKFPPPSPEIGAKPAAMSATDREKTSQQVDKAMWSGTGKAARPLTPITTSPEYSNAKRYKMATEWKTCSQCGESNPASSWHCAVCGARLVEGSAPALAPEKREEQQKVEPRLPQGIPRWPVAVALLNLTGLGLGYLYCHQWRRWLAHFLLTAGLMTIAFTANTARAPLLWVIVFGLWLLWMSFDGWWQARRLAQTGAMEAIGRPWLPVALAILFIGLAIAGFWFYNVLGQREFKAGMVAYSLVDCRTALPYFDRVTTWYRLTLAPNLVTAETKTAECKLIVEAENSRQQNKLAEAIAAYETYLNTYPNAALALPVKTAVAETYAEWATGLRETDNYGEALKKYETLLDQYSDTPLGQQATTLTAETYGEWANQLWETGQYRTALEKYQTIVTRFPETEAAGVAREAIKWANYNWGQALLTQQKYAEAMEKFTLAREESQDPEVVAATEQGYNEALGALSQDTEKGGQALIKETWAMVCDGKPTTSPAIGILDNEPGLAWYDDYQFNLPDNSRAVKPGHFRYAICLEKGKDQVERCSYIPMGTVIRWQQWWEITVRDTLSGEVVERKTFKGSSPPSCPFTENFTYSSTKDIQGRTPEGRDIQNWLARIFTNPPIPQEKPLERDPLLVGTSVHVMTAFSGGDEEARFNEVNKRFTEMTGVEVVHEGIRDFEEVISTRVAGGNQPDVALLPLPGLMGRFADQGVLVPLWPEIVERVQSNYAPVWLDLGSYKGTPYGVFHRVNTKSLVWYPKKAFEAAGYKEPTTWAEMIALSDQIVADGGTPWCIGMESGAATGWVGTDWLEDIMLRTAGPEVYDQWVNHEIPFNDPRVKEAAEYMEQIWFNPDYVLGGTTSILTDDFAEGSLLMFEASPECYMFRQGSFVINFWSENIRANLDEEVGVFAFPQIDEEWGTPALVVGDQIVMFNDRPEVRAYMEYLTTSESVEPWARAGGALFPHQDQDLSWYQVDIERAMASLIRNAQVVRFDASDSMPVEVGAGSFWKGMTDWVSGVDLDTVLAEIEANWPAE